MPAELACVLAATVLLLVSIHGRRIARYCSSNPLISPCRKRIRVAVAWLSVPLTLLFCAGCGLVAPADGGAYILVWLATLGVTFQVLLLASIDLCLGAFVATQQMSQARRDLLAMRARLSAEMMARRSPSRQTR